MKIQIAFFHICKNIDRNSYFAAMEKWQQFQKQIFDQIFKKLSLEDPLQHIADELGLSRNTIYKRYAGYTPLHLEELIHLSAKYDIAVDALLKPTTDRFEFYFPFSRNSEPDPYAFLSNIARDLDYLIKSGNASVWYVSDEIPFFQYMHFDLLFAFKLCIWGRLIWTDGPATDRITPMQLMEAVRQNTRLKELREQLLSMYLIIPTMEIWSTPVVDNTIEQIRYLVYTGQLKDKGMIADILDDMDLLTDHLTDQAARAEKYPVNGRSKPRSALELYHNEMTHTNNTILTRCNNGKSIYLTYDNPNYMKCEDKSLCDYTEQWMQSLQQQSLLISKSAEKHRTHYFQLIREKIAQLRREFDV